MRKVYVECFEDTRERLGCILHWSTQLGFHISKQVFVEPSDQFYAQLVCPAAMTRKPTMHYKDCMSMITVAMVTVLVHLEYKATLRLIMHPMAYHAP